MRKTSAPEMVTFALSLWMLWSIPLVRHGFFFFLKNTNWLIRTQEHSESIKNLVVTVLQLENWVSTTHFAGFSA